jgi:hypothetical protein
MVKKNKNKKINDNDDFDKIIEEFKEKDDKIKEDNKNEEEINLFHQELLEQELINAFPTYTIINFTNPTMCPNYHILFEKYIVQKQPNSIIFISRTHYNSVAFTNKKILLTVMINDVTLTFKSSNINNVIINIRVVIEERECCVCLELITEQNFKMCNICKNVICLKCITDILNSKIKSKLNCVICKSEEYTFI